MTVTYPGKVGKRVNSVTAFTVDVGALGAAVGDVLIFTIMADAQGIALTPAVTTGWTKVIDQVNTGTRVNWLWARTLDAADVAAGMVFGATSGNKTYQAVIVRGADALANWTWGAYGTRAASGGTFSTTAPAITTTVDAEDVLVIVTEATAANESLASPPSSTQGTLFNWTTNDTATNLTEAVATFKYTKAVAGSTGTTTVTFLNTQASNSLGLQVGIPPVPPSDLSLHASLKTSGGLVSGRLRYKAADGVKEVRAVYQVQAGYPDVTAMLTDPLFEVAHRGGSVSFPEMSLHAYTQAAVLGYQALEISLARTSDGVWFGLHDSTLDRTSTPETGLTASALTWAQVQTHQITLGPGAAQPYMRLETLLAAYGRTHVLFIDPKAALSQRTSLLNLLQTYYGSDAEAAKHVVAKYYGVEGNAGGTNGWAFDARARGYKTWGYFYQAEVTSDQITTYQGRWDILGMDYGADSTAWTKAKSFGKPVIAHILPSAASKVTAMAFSPNGLMVSGTALIVPTR